MKNNNSSEAVVNKFLNTIERYNMLDGVENVVVGFSGGADSVCLLHLLNAFKKHFNISLKAVHVNHGIRGEEALRDAAFSRTFCEENSIDFSVEEVNCILEAGETGESVEECGRRLRYGVFNNHAKDNGAIATAHNANDNAETIIFNLARGSALKGVCGIPPVRDNIIRPLITCTRDEIEAYCKENGLSFVIDSTNLCDDYTRNKIRHGILPVLSEINSNFLNNISSFSESTGEIFNYFTSRCQSIYTDISVDGYISTKRLLSFDKAVVKEIIKYAYSFIDTKSLSNKKINELYAFLSSEGRLQVYGDCYAEILKGKLRFFKKENNTEPMCETVDKLPYTYENVFYTIEIKEYINNSENINNLLLDNLIDCDKICGNLSVRSRKEGDSITLFRRGVTKSLKKLFTEQAVPVEKRPFVPVICDDKGVVWVFGFGVAKRCAISHNSNNIIVVGGKDNDK